MTKDFDGEASAATDLDETVFGLFVRQAAASADKIAVVAEDRVVTYGELAVRVIAISRTFADAKLSAEQPVGVFMERHADLVAGLLGIWGAGGAYVAIDPQEPPARVLQLLRESGCRYVLGDKRLLEKLDCEYDADISCDLKPALIDVATINTDATDREVAFRVSRGSSLAYLLFTSGSTGVPKAVEVEHRSIVNLLLGMRERLGFTRKDRYLAVSTIAFDGSVPELFMPLITGGSVLLRHRRRLLEPQKLAADIRDNGVTFFQAGPSVWSVLLDEVPDFPRLRCAISTGEAVAPSIAKRLLPVGDKVWNLYGPTETTVWATGHQLTEENLAALSSTEMSAPIGKAVPGLTAHVIKEGGATAARGEQGELCIGGVGVSRGYRGNPDLTAERFVEIDGERVYRTGDIVSEDTQGVLHYYGRNDEQLSIRGVRVEPGEVEATILKNNGVAQAAVTWFQTPTGARAIVAAVVLAPDASLSASNLHEALKHLLPLQMIPARFLFVPWLPANTNGKIDRNAIRKAALASPEDEPIQNRRAAKTNTEEVIARIWRRKLKINEIEAEDHFLSIGGDSLAAVQMMVEVEHRFEIELPMQLIYEAPTLGEFSRRVDDYRACNDPSEKHDFIYPLVETPNVTPLFFCLNDLSIARRWTVPCPLFHIAFWAKGSGFVQAGTLEGMAASHIDRIRKFQPRGPYRLAGYSMGGLVAYEMAQQLKAKGETVEFLFLLDPTAPLNAAGIKREWPNFRVGAHQDPFKDRFARHLRWIARGPRERGFRVWISKILFFHKLPCTPWAIYHLTHFFGRHPNRLSLALLPRDLWKAYMFVARRLIKNYVAEPYNGQVLAVFIESGTSADIWGPLLGPDAKMHKIEAEHGSLFKDPALDQWMGWLQDYVLHMHDKNF